MATAVSSRAATVTLAWDPSTGSSTAGYRVYQGVNTRAYTNFVEVGNVTSATLTGLVAGVKYYFAATAYDRVGLESDYSSEVSYTIPLSNPPLPSVVLTAPPE